MNNEWESKLDTILKYSIREITEKADAKGRYIAASGFLRRGDTVESVAKRTCLPIEIVQEIKEEVDAAIGRT